MNKQLPKWRKSAFTLLIMLFFSAISYAQPGEPNWEILGYATEAGGTSGGGEETTAKVVATCSTGNEIDAAITNYTDNFGGSGGLILKIDGTITPSNSPDKVIYIKDFDDVTVLGVDNRGVFDGIGIKVNKTSNVIIRNVTVAKVLSGEKDGISIEGPADHIWVDHCELYAEYGDITGDGIINGEDKDYYDGLLDLKDASEYVTYSWNVLHASFKAMLVGSSDGDTDDRKLTIHHNFFYDINSRLPLFRGGNAHIFNNYYKDIYSSGINSRMGACIKIENNYFVNAHNPFLSAYSNTIGNAELINNYTDEDCTWTPVDNEDYFELGECAPSIPYTYASAVDATANVPAIVEMFAGVGKYDLDPSANYTLTVNAGTNGSVTPGTDDYFSGMDVTLTAIPDNGYIFEKWTGDLTGTTNPISIEMTSDKTIAASFIVDPTPYYVLNVSKVGTGSVTQSPSEETYREGSDVTLTASAGAGYQFAGWSGDATGTASSVTVSMSAAKYLTATFTEITPEANITVQAYEACDYSANNGTLIFTNHTGFSGDGFIDLTNESGSFAEFKIDATTAQSATLEITYANGSTSRNMDLYINGAVVKSNIAFAGFADWDTWGTVSELVNLTEGRNTIKLLNTDGTGGPNFDKFTLSATSIMKGGCETLSAESISLGTEITIFPTVVDSKVNIKVSSSTSETLTATLVSISGAAIQQEQYNTTAGSTIKTMDLSMNESGIYLLIIETATTTKTFKVIKK